MDPFSPLSSTEEYDEIQNLALSPVDERWMPPTLESSSLAEQPVMFSQSYDVAPPAPFMPPTSLDGTNTATARRRSFRHLMAERLRREKLSQSYGELHEILPSMKKASKNNIVQSAAVYVNELRREVEQLSKCNEQLSEMIAKRNDAMAGVDEIKLIVQNKHHASTLSLAMAILRCLKNMNVRARSLQFDFSGHQLLILLGFERGVASAADIERELQIALLEAQ